MKHAGRQADKILAALHAATFTNRHPGGPGCWVSVTEILRLGIAQYNARIHELRRELAPQGMDIINFKAWSDADECYHSWYRLSLRDTKRGGKL